MEWNPHDESFCLKKCGLKLRVRCIGLGILKCDDFVEHKIKQAEKKVYELAMLDIGFFLGEMSVLHKDKPLSFQYQKACDKFQEKMKITKKIVIKKDLFKKEEEK